MQSPFYKNKIGLIELSRNNRTEETRTMAVMTSAICDEIRKDAQKLSRQLSTLVPDAEILVYRSRQGFLDGLSQEHKICNMVFMGLDGENGKSLETVRAMRLRGNYIPVVMVADNEKFYKEAFEVFAYNYLTKPVESRELEHVLIPILSACKREGGRALYFHYRTQVYTLQHSRLSYISSSLHNVTFHLTDGKKISCRARLGDFEGQLAESSFLRCHQSFCINLEKVTSLKKNSFVIGQTEIPISRAYLKNARQKYKDYLAQQKVCS